MSSVALKLYEQQTLLNLSGASGTAYADFSVTSGSKLVTTLLVKNISVGATLVVTVENTFDTDEAFTVLDTITATSAGEQKSVITDFNSFFRIRYTISGGTVTFKTAVILHINDNINLEVTTGSTLTTTSKTNDGAGNPITSIAESIDRALHVRDKSRTIDVQWDSVTKTQPDAYTDLYTYSFLSNPVLAVTVSYSDVDHFNFVGVNKVYF